MPTDTPEFWNEMWSGTEDWDSGPDEILVDQAKSLTPGRALELGCGTGSNAVWLAMTGWQVTALDYSNVAVEKGRELADRQDVSVEFTVGDASSYQPQGHFNLIMCFYIQLSPRQRTRMLSNVLKALAPGGTLLFVGHDRSDPPHQWSRQDLSTLTTPEEVVAELPGLVIDEASVYERSSIGSHPSHMHDIHKGIETGEHSGSHGSNSTVVRASRLST